MQYTIHETKTTTKQLMYTGNIQQHQRNTDSKTPENSLEMELVIFKKSYSAYVMNISDHDNIIIHNF